MSDDLEQIRHELTLLRHAHDEARAETRAGIAGLQAEIREQFNRLADAIGDLRSDLGYHLQTHDLGDGGDE